MGHINPVMSVLFAGVLVGCAAMPPLQQRSETSAAAIRAAEEVGAPQVPRAALYLQRAKEASAKAKLLEADGEKAQAASMLLRAEADANLAVVVARADTERAKALAAAERVRQLKLSNQ